MTTDYISARAMLDFRQFPLSRQQYSLRRIALALADSEDEFLRQQVAKAIELGEEARNLELDWRGHQAEKEHGAEARQLDIELDAALCSLHAFLKTTIESFGESTPRGAQASHALERLFPLGVRQVIHLPFVEEEDTVRIMLNRVTSESALGKALREIGAIPLLDRVTECHARYANALPRREPGPSYDEVREARRQGQERLSEIVFLVMARLLRGQHKGKQAAGLKQALGEVLEQDQAIKRYYKRRRRVTDVDPMTGELVDSEEDEEEELEDDSDSADFNEAEAA
ncbi:MAG: hypothetical protein R3F62_27310 [Planctomycetota bacterium]